MKKRLVVSVLLVFAIVSAFHCRKNDSGNRLKGVLVDDFCGQTIVRIIDGDFDPNLVVASWNDPLTNNTYSNAFTVINFCDLQGRFTPGEVFCFRFTNAQSSKNCFSCDALRPTPAKRNNINILY